ncbi:MAG: hypothetical protein LBM41_02745 [Ruminococcus sp.]|nr:hypothetical protein [Ruminococcus sp.]
MNMKKTIAAVAASALAISAIAVPASAEVADAAVLGTKFTYSLVKNYNIGKDGSTAVQTQTTALGDADAAEGVAYDDGFLISLDGVDLNKEITITVLPGAGVQGTAFNANFVLPGGTDGNTTFIPAGITYITDGFVNKDDGTTAPYTDDDGTEDNFLYVQPGVVGFAGPAVITIKGSAVIPIAETDANYHSQESARNYIMKEHPTLFSVYEVGGVATGSNASAEGNLAILQAGTATGWDNGDDDSELATTLDTDNYEFATDPTSAAAPDFAESAKMVTGLAKPTMTAVSKPYKSTLNGGLGTWVATGGNTTDIIAWLQNSGTIADLPAGLAAQAAKNADNDANGCVVLKSTNKAAANNNYKNVQAVLNDCITSYDNVTFTFNTAKDKVIQNAGSDYNDFYTGSQPWYGGTDKYMNAFGQSIYNLYGDEGSGNQPFDPNIYFQPFASLGVAYNLFSGALIINDSYTMQLADTNVFSYNGTSLTFDWDTLRDNIYTTTNTALDLIWTMKLATSVDWYWDSLDVAFAVDSGDTGESAAPVTEDDELIDEEITDAPVDEPTDELPEVLPEEPVAPAANPGTGNAPIALAVIPVALAAAAIIAKKRK